MDYRPDTQVPLSKSDVTNLVKKRFGHLGEEATELMLQLALSPRRMRSFMKHLDLDPNRDLKGQLDALNYYLVRQTDLRSFLVRARIEVSKDYRDTTRGDTQGEGRSISSRRPASEQDARHSRYGRSMPKPPENQTPRPTQEVPRPTTPVENKVPTPPPTQPTPVQPAPAPPSPAQVVPEAQPNTTPTPPESLPGQPVTEAAPPRPMVDVPSYKGPCRRVGLAERRSGKDRRQKLDAVMQNRRFGADRRKNEKGRRKDDIY